jgi:hypothetical protein
MAQLRAATDHATTTPPRSDGKSQAGLPAHARRQPALRADAKVVVTTDSNHGKKVYPNLAREMALTDVDQLWVADITYIRLREEFSIELFVWAILYS